LEIPYGFGRLVIRFIQTQIFCSLLQIRYDLFLIVSHPAAVLPPNHPAHFSQYTSKWHYFTVKKYVQEIIEGSYMHHPATEERTTCSERNIFFSHGVTAQACLGMAVWTEYQ
jgi:hypothetical protein